MIKNVYIVILLTALCSCNMSDKEEEKTLAKTSLPYFNSADFTPVWLDEKDAGYSDIHKISWFQLTNQNGETITNNTFEGKIYVADFFFTICPGICPKLTKHMSLLQEEFAGDDNVKFISHTVMPSRDSVSVLKEYAEENNVVDGKWHLVTGPEKEIFDLARHDYFADEDFVKTKDEIAFVHTENFVLIDQKGRIRGVYNGTIELETHRLIKHIKLLEQEES